MKLTPEDIALFADLGSIDPSVNYTDDKLEVAFRRNNEDFRIIQRADGTITAFYGEMGEGYRDAAHLVSSSQFANLSLWADNQRRLLSSSGFENTIRLSGKLINLNDESTSSITSASDDELHKTDSRFQNEVTILDGPAGIGKTTFIRQLTLERANTFPESGNRLLLHVESRGRVLQNLTDLMAYSLQTLRVPVLYFQVPLLVRLGLVTLAIDGFDELADPYGYKGAWSQLNELIENVRGEGAIILSGRETFISSERVLESLTGIDTETDKIRRISLEAPSPSIAREWLKTHGWTDADFSNKRISSLLQDKSIALRPFFLSKLREREVVSSIMKKQRGSPLQVLVDLMIDRESGKFGDQLEVGEGRELLRRFILGFLRETARDMADNQSDSIPVNNLEWLAEFEAYELFDSEVVKVLVQRCGSIALLETSNSPSQRQFSNEQIQQHFLSLDAFRTIGEGEISKYLRRNILGADFLKIFTDMVSNEEIGVVETFCFSAFKMQADAGSGDRARLNLIALLVSAVCGGEVSKRFVVEDTGVDDLLFQGSVPNLSFRRVAVNRVYAHSADLSQVHVSTDSSINTLLLDDDTIPNSDWPNPSIVEFPDRVLRERAEIDGWLQGFRPIESVHSSISAEALHLLGRVSRYPSFWLRGDPAQSDIVGSKILSHSDWDALKELLLSNDLLEIDDSRDAAGRPAVFFHFKNRDRIKLLMSEHCTDPFLDKLIRKFPRIDVEDEQ